MGRPGEYIDVAAKIKYQEPNTPKCQAQQPLAIIAGFP